MFSVLKAVPSEPGRPIVEAVGHDSVTLTWDAPNQDGGSEVTHYMLEQRNEDDRPDDWDLVDDQLTLTKAIVDGLVNRDEYTFRVYAGNSVGWSRPSKCSAAVIIKGRVVYIPYFFSFACCSYGLIFHSSSSCWTSTIHCHLVL